MATFQIPENGIVQARIICQWDAQVSYNVLHCARQGDPGPQVWDNDFLDAMVVTFPALYAAVLGNNASLRGFSVQLVSPGPASQVIYRQNITPGEGTGNMLPSQTCGLIQLPHSGPATTRKGRVYLPFPSSDFNAEGFPLAGYQDDAQAIANVFNAQFDVPLSGGGTQPFAWCVYATSTNTYYPVGGANQRPAWATQRRRGAFGRQNVSPV